MIALVVVLLLLLVGGGVAAVVLLGGDDDVATSPTTTTATSTPRTLVDRSTTTTERQTTTTERRTTTTSGSTRTIDEASRALFQSAITDQYPDQDLDLAEGLAVASCDLLDATGGDALSAIESLATEAVDAGEDPERIGFIFGAGVVAFCPEYTAALEEAIG
jgi:hypothetical protein